MHGHSEKAELDGRRELEFERLAGGPDFPGLAGIAEQGDVVKEEEENRCGW
jgi:hypothetical protein